MYTGALGLKSHVRVKCLRNYLNLTWNQICLKNIYLFQLLARLNNPFSANISILYCLKTQENLFPSDVFRAYKVKHWLNKMV